MLDVLAFLSHLPSLSFASAHVPFLYHQLLSLGLQETGKKKKRGLLEGKEHGSYWLNPRRQA